jgi:hypothetical protein
MKKKSLISLLMVFVMMMSVFAASCSKTPKTIEEYINNESVVKVDWRSGKQKTIKKKKGGRAASLYMSNLRHIYKCARLEFNDPDLGLFPIPTDPFEYYSVPKTPAPRTMKDLGW